MDIPLDVVNLIIDQLDYNSIAQFSVTCTEYKHFASVPKRMLRRREVIRCAKIYGCLTLPPIGLEELIIYLHPLHKWKETFGKCTTFIIHVVLADIWFRRGPPPQLERYDPELFRLITDDMRMGAPPDEALIYSFYKNIFLNSPMDRDFINFVKEYY